MSHLLDEAMKNGAVPMCPKHLVPADQQGEKDPTAWGHLWLDDPGTGPFPFPEHPGQSRRYYCITRVQTATKAEEEAAA